MYLKAREFSITDSMSQPTTIALHRYSVHNYKYANVYMYMYVCPTNQPLSDLKASAEKMANRQNVPALELAMLLKQLLTCIPTHLHICTTKATSLLALQIACTRLFVCKIHMHVLLLQVLELRAKSTHFSHLFTAKPAASEPVKMMKILCKFSNNIRRAKK